MSEQNAVNTHPYALEVVPPREGASQYHWAIRKHGKLVQRSDRGQPTENKAHANGMAQIEKLLHGVEDR